VKYRRVQPSCGDHILSEADNWYVPRRLTPEMNRLLETTDVPFGRAGVETVSPDICSRYPMVAVAGRLGAGQCSLAAGETRRFA